MPRITRKELEHAVKGFREGTGLPIFVEYSGAPQRPRIFLPSGRELSPRGTVTEIYNWFDAFVQGWVEKGRAWRVIPHEQAWDNLKRR